MKKKHLNTLKIASLTLMLGCFTVGGVYNHYQDKQQDHVVKIERKVQPKYASYDDEEYTISFDDNELNNYTWNNLFEYIDAGFNNVFELCSSDESTLNFTDFSEQEQEVYFSSESSLDFYNGEDALNPQADTYFYLDSATKKFNVYDANNDELLHMNYLYLCISSSLYNSVKSAIELDIQANQPVSQGESIIGAITSGLGLIPELANEFLTGFSALFWNSQTSSLTTFSYFALVFLGIAITMAVVKLVLAIIRGNTGA